MKKIYLPFLGMALLISCKTVQDTEENVVVADEATTTTIDLDYMDTEVRPQDDFFQFANGTWVKNNPVPPSESRWGSFNELDKANMEKLTTILEFSKARKGEKGSMDQILGSYYESYTDMKRRNELGLSPVQDQLDAIEKINSKGQLVGIVAAQHKKGIGSVFRFGVGQDLKNVEVNIANVAQGGLGLPNRDYYFEEDKEQILIEYEKHIASIVRMTGKNITEASAFASSVVKFEKELAKKMLKPAELRIPENNYHKQSREEAITSFGKFDFEAYLSKIGIGSFDSLNVAHPKHLMMVSKMIDDVSLQDWKNYLYWCTINHYAGHLDNNFVEQNFAFYGTVMSGTEEMKPINERAIKEITHIEIGELLGKAFVEEHYSETAQVRINELVDNLLIVFRSRIQDLEWMSGETKTQAINKLNAIGRKLGFPDKWTDFSGISLTSNEYAANYDAISMFSVQKNYNKLGEPVDKDEWGMPAHMVNAYYHPLLNEIAFPAGIMQPPFFSEEYEDAVNYGRIGMVIGHEFTHGFDDMGSKFAADGSFTNWWTEKDRTLFEERTEILGNTFAGFCPIDGHCVNPQLTMGENIADLGGLTLAFHAYQLTDEYKSGVKRKGFTPAQRFFIAYAQLWKINFTDAELKKRIATDPHSPGMYRVNGPLMNCPEFFEAFNVQEGDPMRNAEGKVAKIW